MKARVDYQRMTEEMYLPRETPEKLPDRAMLIGAAVLTLIPLLIFICYFSAAAMPRPFLHSSDFGLDSPAMHRTDPRIVRHH
jgi:hypothetical protein